MHPHPRLLWVVIGLTLLVLLGMGFNGSQTASDPVIDVPPVYLPAIARNYPSYFPPPLEARKEGWLRKWRESQDPHHCLQAAGTPYYLERERGEAGWLAAVIETQSVTEVELEVHLDEKVVIAGTAEYFDTACEFPRLEAHSLEVIQVVPDGDGPP
ncbi:MAG: hypothetical protein MAG451_01610 [Anaerolineales bacterium]|nr:hypothetical protein [Anaerolineales bacterium]